MKELNTIFVSGYTQAPKGTKMHESGSTVGVMFEVDKRSHHIIDAECTFITKLAQSYFRKTMIGYNFETDLEEMISTLDTHLFIPSIGSIIVATRVAHQRYMDSVIGEN